MILQKQRFDDADDEQSDGSVAYHYQGYNYRVSVAGSEFRVRTYDDEPCEVLVIYPASAHQLPQAPLLVRFLTVELGCTLVKFYHGPSGLYRAVDLVTLAFNEPSAV